jgi:hypothetical protein
MKDDQMRHGPFLPALAIWLMQGPSKTNLADLDVLFSARHSSL